MADEPAPKKSESSGLVTKVVAGVFGAIIAPIVVAVGIQWGNKLHTPDKADAAAKEAPKNTPKEVVKDTPPPPPPSGVVNLITPNLGDHFYQYAWSEEQKKDVRSEAMDPNLFRYEDKPGRLVVLGNGKRNATITTRAEFEDYVLHLWYRWGEKPPVGPKDPPQGYPRKGSIGVHGFGADGTVSGVFGQNVSVRIGEGQFGTINLNGLAGVLTGQARVVETVLPDKRLRRVYSPDAPAVPVASREPENWQPALIMQRGFPAETAYVAPGNWTGEGVGVGWHPPGDPTMKKVFPPYDPGEWNKVRVECRGTSVKVHVGTRLVNEVTDLNVHRGRIGLSSMGADWEIGRLEVEPLPPPKATPPPAEKKSP
jgi:hypothetical protein